MMFPFDKILRTWSFNAVVCRELHTKCTKIYNAPAGQLFFCLLNLLFGDVLVVVAAVVCSVKLEVAS